MERARGAELEELLAHSDWLTRLARRLTSPADAEDAVQETWLAARRSPPDPDRPPRPWLTGVMRNLVRARWQSDRRRRRREQAQALLSPDREAAVDTLYERVEMQRLVAERVMALDEPLRTVLLLRYFDGHDSAQIAAILQLPAGTVRWRLKMGIDRLRADMDERFGGNRRAWAFVLAPVGAGLPLFGTAITVCLALAAGGSLGLALGVWSGQGAGVDAVRSADGERPSVAPNARALLRPRSRQDVPRLRVAAPVDAIAGSVLEQGEPADDVVVVASAVDATAGPAPYPDPPPPRSKSAEGGRFLLSSLPPGRYRLTASGHTGGTARTAEIEVVAGRAIEGVVLELGGAPAGLAGQVLDPAGEGIARARVRARLYEPGSAAPLVFETESGCLGRYHLELEAGLYDFELEAEGYAPVQFSLLVQTPLLRQLRPVPKPTTHDHDHQDGRP